MEGEPHMSNLATPGAIKAMVQKYNFHFSKKLGQNFLKEQSIVDKIVGGANLTPEDTVVEVGPGMGTLTAALAREAGKVITVEIDRKLLPVLADNLSEFKNVEVVHDDILKVNLDKLVTEKAGQEKYKVVANLPYYITTPVILHLLEEKFALELVVVMVQKEVAQRIKASPGGKEYGALSVAVQYYAEPEILFTVPKTAFIPQPEVESAVLRLNIRENPPVNVIDEKMFFKVVKGAFGQRRKTLLNALVNAPLGLGKKETEEILEKAGIVPSRRGETLSLEEFARISDLITKRRVEK